MLVMKFGGTSVGDAQRFAVVADIVCASGEQTVVVVSAMSGVTDSLIQGARAAAEGQDDAYRAIRANLLARHLETVDTLLAESSERLDVAGFIEDRLHDFERLCRSIAVLGELTARGSDAVASIGEELSAHILAATLRARGSRAQAVSATELIVTDDNFGAANPLMEATTARVRQRLIPLLERSVMPVVTGYIAATAEGVTTTLGRGGSDYSAAIVGACLDADEVWIWTDVDGILTADPKIVPEARPLTELSYDEAAALAYFGADVLHPKTIKPVVEKGIPLRIVNSFNPTHPGTLIVKEPRPDRQTVPAIISTTGLSLVSVAGQGDGWTPQIAARALQRLAEGGVDVLMFSQSFSERSLNLVIRQPDQEHCLRLLRREFEDELALRRLSHLRVQEEVGTVSVVGAPGRDGASIVAQVFAALGRQGTRVISVAQAASEYNVSFVVPADEVEDTVRSVHRELGL
ncbi:MAG: aspartate kinase [Anaerolineae bacterium]|nr:aspartate kinase [Anaerolineae bacterium]